MLSQALDVAHFEPNTFRRGDHITARGKLPIREHVLVDEGIGLPEFAEDPLTNRARPSFAETYDAVVHEESARLQRAIRRLEVHGKMGQANVLDHPPARDLVVVVVCPQRPVITTRAATGVGEPRLFYSFPRQRCLILAERNTCR